MATIKTTKTAVKKAETKDVKKAVVKPIKKESDVFAVIQTGGKQYLVQEGDTIKVEKLNNIGEDGSIVFDEILLIINGNDVKIGTPTVKGAKVTASLDEHGRNKKVTVIRYKSKVRYFKKKGHKQPHSKITITSIK